MLILASCFKRCQMPTQSTCLYYYHDNEASKCVSNGEKVFVAGVKGFFLNSQLHIKKMMIYVD